MTDISEPALEKAIAKAKEQAPGFVGKVETSKVDVSKEADVQAAVEKLDAWGGLDVIFNNAGIMHGDDAGMLQLSSHLKIHTNRFRRRRDIREDLGLDPSHQRQRSLVRQQARRSRPSQAQEDPRQHHQHRLSRCSRRIRNSTARLHRLQGRSPRHDP